MTIRMRLARALAPIAFRLGFCSQANDLEWYASHGHSRYTAMAERGDCRLWPLGIYRAPSSEPRS